MNKCRQCGSWFTVTDHTQLLGFCSDSCLQTWEDTKALMTEGHIDKFQGYIS